MAKNFSDPVFEEVEASSLLSYRCSPEITKRDFRGIVLNGPGEVYYEPGLPDPLSGSFAKIIVCGTYQFKYDTLGLNGNFVESIVLVAVDVKSNQTYSGTMAMPYNKTVVPDAVESMGLQHQDFKDDVITKYFNPNLAEVLKLPEHEADYFIYATLGPYKSNVVRVGVRKRSSK